MIKNENVKAFVRQTLGCMCPDEVFEYIDCQHNVKLDGDLLLNSKINVGNRLLIYVIEANDPDFIKNSLSTLISLGKNERDKRGFNRFRLVIVTDKMSEIKHIAQKIFEDSGHKDEKVHLHVVSRNEIPG